MLAWQCSWRSAARVRYGAAGRVAPALCRVLSLVGLLPLIGCDQPGPVLVPVQGRITLDGKPVSEHVVTFSPIGNTQGNGAMGPTDEQGKFALTDVRGETGAHVGHYKVHLYPTPVTPPNDVPSDVVSVGGGGGSVPAIYIDPNYTPVVATVPEEGCFVEITLTANGQGATSETKPLPD